MSRKSAAIGFLVGLTAGLVIALPHFQRHVLKDLSRLSQHFGYKRGYAEGMKQQLEQQQK